MVDEIILQEITSKDVKALFELMNNNRHLLERYFPVTVDNTRTVIGTEFYIQSLLKKRNNNEWICFAIYHHKKMIGLFHIKNIEWRIPKCELAYFIDHSYQGKGLMSALMKKVIDICFHQLMMNKVYVRISPDNISSHKVAVKNGFETEGILKREFRTETGELIDLEYLGLVNPALK